MPAQRYVEENRLDAMLTSKRSVDITPEVNLGKSVTHTPVPSANKAAHSIFETPEEKSSEVQIRNISVLQFFFRKNICDTNDPVMLNFITSYLLSAYEIWGKVMFSLASVILSTGGCGIDGGVVKSVVSCRGVVCTGGVV